MRNPEKATNLGIERTFDFILKLKNLVKASLKGIDKLLLISGNEVGQRLQHLAVIDAVKQAGVKTIILQSIFACW